MDLAAAVVANKQPLEVVQPGEGALDNPASARLPSAASRPATRQAANGRPPGARGPQRSLPEAVASREPGLVKRGRMRRETLIRRTTCRERRPTSML